MRLTFDIPDEQHEVLVRCIPHGWRKHTYRALIQGFVEQLEKDPTSVMKDLITKHLDITAMTMKGMENGFDKRTDKPTGANQEGET
jgi:hypothetical protein|tara:strand:- start:3250 stop:3507 length:258 start_codon:yes stop_codon:yes gene_type:complete